MPQAEERLKRMERVRKVIEEEELDALLITGEANRIYLSGFDGSFGFVLLDKEGRGMLLTDFRYQEQAERQAPQMEIINYQGEFGENVSQVSEREGWTRLGLEEEHLSYARFRDLRSKFEGELVPVKKKIESLRAVKEAAELENLKKSAALLDGAFQHLCGLLKPGVTETEVALELEYYLRKQESQGPAFRFIVASGERGAMPHGVASSKIIQEGETVTVDFGVYASGYASDITRNFALGEPDERIRDIHQLVLQAQQAALEGIKAGITGREADAKAREIIEANGYGKYFGHGLGHGVGLEPHELPTLSPRFEEPLEPGAVVTVEPGIYLPGVGGIRIEDMVIVNEEGVERLTYSPKELLVL